MDVFGLLFILSACCLYFLYYGFKHFDKITKEIKPIESTILFFIVIISFFYYMWWAKPEQKVKRAYKCLTENLDDYWRLLDEKAHKISDLKGENVNWLRLGVDSLLINEVYNGKYKLMLFSIMDEE